MAIKKRCIRCLQILREDGTCSNIKCVKYTPASETVDTEDIEIKDGDE